MHSEPRTTLPAPPEPEAEPRRFTVAVDFDGVLHSYVSGWQGGTEIPDPPVEGAIEWLNEIAGEYDVVIFTTRAREEGGAEAVAAWLREQGCLHNFPVTAEKVKAVLYLDDRAWRFRGQFPTVKTIRYASPWKTGDPPLRSARDAIRRAREQTIKVEQVAGRRKQELVEVKTALIREILRDKDDAWFDAWWGEAQRVSWDERIRLARAEVA